MTYNLRELTATIVAETYGLDVEPIFTRPAPEHGDFSTNIAMQLAKKIGKPPLEIAESLKESLLTRGDFKIEIAGAGFINITLSDQDVFSAAKQAIVFAKPLEGKTVVTEYSDPNPFKTLHAGHLYTSLVGDAISNLVETGGAKVHRVNFGGDVGLHVAKTMWAVINKLDGEHPDKLKNIPNHEKLSWVSDLYVQGNQAYEKDDSVRKSIVEINKRIYELHDKNDRDSDFARIYWTCRQWSYDGFGVLYDRLGMQPFEKYYPESATTKPGIDAVKDGLKKGIFEESDGAIVYTKGPHTRVFINSEGLPTYEAKDLGLALTKWQDYKFDQSLIITGDDIREYMKVVTKAVSEFNKDAAERTVHLTHGQVKLAGGVKMSSRTGNILRAEDIFEAARQAADKLGNNVTDEVVLGAVRYSFLRSRAGGSVIYDPEESVALDGNSGPYLQYALVRARSILKKSGENKAINEIEELDKQERRLARTISMYPEALTVALNDYSPHHICNYLYQLAVTFNRFYEQSRVIGDERSGLRLTLVAAYEQVLASGLTVLGMPQPEKM